jgi:hypothetical protein
LIRRGDRLITDHERSRGGHTWAPVVESTKLDAVAATSDAARADADEIEARNTYRRISDAAATKPSL